MPEARLLVIQPYDKTAIPAIERAIQEADLGLNPSNDGNLIRLAFPSLTEERRKELIRLVRHLAEDGRVSRFGTCDGTARTISSRKTSPKMTIRRAEKVLQEMTDQHIERLDEILLAKEEELLEV